MTWTLSEETRRTLRASLFEAGFVVLGVVLALVANEWRLAVQDEARAEAARAAIRHELTANREAAQDAQDYHRGLLERMREQRGAGTAPALGDFHRGFIAPARLSRAAWQSASATGATAHFDYDEVLDYARLYAMQDRYDDQARSVGLVFYGEIVRGGTAAIAARPANLASIIGMFVHRESELVEAYTLRLDPAPADAPAP